MLYVDRVLASSILYPHNYGAPVCCAVCAVRAVLRVLCALCALCRAVRPMRRVSVTLRGSPCPCSPLGCVCALALLGRIHPADAV
jgi:hypothetical protein